MFIHIFIIVQPSLVMTRLGQYTLQLGTSWLLPVHQLIPCALYVCLTVKPRFKLKPQNTTAVEGYPTMIHCMATGDPLPTIHWDKNNQVNGFDVRRFKVCTTTKACLTSMKTIALDNKAASLCTCYLFKDNRMTASVQYAPINFSGSC